MKNTNKFTKDYRKTPEQNKKRIGKDPEDTLSKRLKNGLLTFGVAAILIIFAVVMIQRLRVLTIPTQAQKNEQSRAVVKKISKKRALDRSYSKVMTLGDMDAAMDESQEAAKHFFDAKTIYPRSLEPRIELAKAYFKRCEEQRGYCIRVARELMYARYFVNEDTKPELIEELDGLQQQLDKIYTIKDSTMLYVF